MMHIRRLDRLNLQRKYGLNSERLLPWPGLDVPFDGAWCIVPAGGQSTMHSHDEHEIFIAMAGRATLVVDEEPTPFAAGDIAHLPSGCRHYVIGDQANDFEFYALWWDASISRPFAARHEKARSTVTR